MALRCCLNLNTYSLCCYLQMLGHGAHDQKRDLGDGTEARRLSSHAYLRCGVGMCHHPLRDMRTGRKTDGQTGGSGNRRAGAGLLCERAVCVCVSVELGGAVRPRYAACLPAAPLTLFLGAVRAHHCWASCHYWPEPVLRGERLKEREIESRWPGCWRGGATCQSLRGFTGREALCDMRGDVAQQSSQCRHACIVVYMLYVVFGCKFLWCCCSLAMKQVDCCSIYISDVLVFIVG